MKEQRRMSSISPERRKIQTSIMKEERRCNIPSISTGDHCSPSLQFYFANILRNSRDASTLSLKPSRNLLIKFSSAPNLFTTQRDKEKQEQVFKSNPSFQILTDDARPHLNKRTVENLHATMRRVSTASRLDRWDCDEQNQIQIQQSKGTMPILQRQQQQQPHQQQKQTKHAESPSWPSPTSSSVAKGTKTTGLAHSFDSLDLNKEKYIAMSCTKPFSHSSRNVRKPTRAPSFNKSSKLSSTLSSKLRDELKSGSNEKQCGKKHGNKKRPERLGSQKAGRNQERCTSLPLLSPTSSKVSNDCPFKPPSRLPFLTVVEDGSSSSQNAKQNVQKETRYLSNGGAMEKCSSLQDISRSRRKQQRGGRKEGRKSLFLRAPTTSEPSNGSKMKSSTRLNDKPLSRKKNEKTQKERCNSCPCLSQTTSVSAMKAMTSVHDLSLSRWKEGDGRQERRNSLPLIFPATNDVLNRSDNDLSLTRTEQEEGRKERRNSLSVLSPSASELSSYFSFEETTGASLLTRQEQVDDGIEDYMRSSCSSLPTYTPLSVEDMDIPILVKASKKERRRKRHSDPIQHCRFLAEETNKSRNSSLVRPKRQSSNNSMTKVCYTVNDGRVKATTISNTSTIVPA